MKPSERKVFRCAIYTRKSTEHNLDLEFNSLDAQREACEASRARPMKAGASLPAATTTGPSRVPPWNAPPCSSCLQTSVPAESISWWSIRWIA